MHQKEKIQLVSETEPSLHDNGKNFVYFLPKNQDTPVVVEYNGTQFPLSCILGQSKQ